MSISSKIYKVVAALDGSLDENYEEKETAATVEQALDELAEAILANPILNPQTESIEETPGAEVTPKTSSTEATS